VVSAATVALVVLGGTAVWRLEDAVSHVESQVEQVEAEVDASLTWLLARLGWHPAADGAGIVWLQGGIRLRTGPR
jgi:hypothetical protein